MASRLNATALRYTCVDSRRRQSGQPGRGPRRLSRHGRGICMRLRRRTGAGRLRCRYPQGRAIARVVIAEPPVHC